MLDAHHGIANCNKNIKLDWNVAIQQFSFLLCVGFASFGIHWQRGELNLKYFWWVCATLSFIYEIHAAGIITFKKLILNMGNINI